MRKYIHLERYGLLMGGNNALRKLVCAVFMLCAAFSVIAATDVASNGNWNTASTWSSSTTPASGDTLLIPAGVTVTVNCNCGTYANMHIIVYGTLNFPGGKKINLTSNGRVDVYSGGRITGSNNGDKINVNGNSVWTGSDPDVTGPSSCDNGGCAPNAALPVEFLGMTFRLKDDEITLSWSTSTELNNDFFTIEYSEDYEQWYEEAKVLGSGNSQVNQEYNYSFNLSNRNVDIKYIRLSQTDFDGTTKFLAHASISVAAQDKPKFYPNPSQGELNLFLPEDGTISVISINGFQVLTEFVDEGLQKLDLSKLKSGLYVIQFQNRTGEVIFKDRFLKL